MNKTDYLNAIIGKSLCYAIKSPDTELYDFGFGEETSEKNALNGKLSRKIIVPFSPESVLSGVGNKDCGSGIPLGNLLFLACPFPKGYVEDCIVRSGFYDVFAVIRLFVPYVFLLQRYGFSGAYVPCGMLPLCYIPALEQK